MTRDPVRYIPNPTPCGRSRRHTDLPSEVGEETQQGGTCCLVVEDGERAVRRHGISP